MIPESKLVKSEITIRELALPEEVKLTRKSLIRWLALSMGLISPNESRRLLLDILEVLFYFHIKKEAPTTKQIMDKITEFGGKKSTEKAVYYHLLKLKDGGFITRKKGQYYLGDGEWKQMNEVFRDFYNRQTTPAFGKINEAFEKLDSVYNL
ncbi:hypothetical protein HYT84_04065 [Candidatus Micrarchaeota archaeon]|nr:hypothetical protein [Candidatus Micrarchaeota archaeon]